GNSSTAVTIGAVTFTLNSDGDQYEAFGTSPLRDDVAFLNNTTASSISWTLTGLTAGQAYDLILFGQSFNGSPANPADFSITGHDAGNGVGSPVTLDAENDGNFTGVIAVGGTISGTLAIPSGQTTAAAWSGLQFEEANEGQPAVPEPSTAVLAALSLASIVGTRRRRRR
ncbi:MAG: PEP-CTERM sorting domain-containing protein, partial [Pirellulales bacterium]|nr:PEP-CTERM sorting domain-containing protein [Pirellulales bacterium]